MSPSASSCARSRRVRRSGRLGGVADRALERGGGNNRVFRVRCARRATLFAQAILQTSSRSARSLRCRDGVPALRVQTRVSTRSRARSRGRPRPAIALLTWIEGRRVDGARCAAPRDVDAALGFLERLNATRAHRGAQAARRRVRGLLHRGRAPRVGRAAASTRLAGQADEPARSFARTRLLPAWARVAEQCAAALAAAGPTRRACSARASAASRRRTSAFTTRWLATTAAVVVPRFRVRRLGRPGEAGRRFLLRRSRCRWHASSLRCIRRTGVVRMLGTAEHRARAHRLLRPVFRLKWCCIVLERIPAGGPAGARSPAR